MHLHRHVDDLLGVFGGGHLGHGRLAGNACALVAQPRRAIRQERGRVQHGGHLSDLGLGDLEVTQALAKHLARTRPADGLVQRTPPKAQSCRRHRGAEHIERGHGNLEALARFANALLGSDLAVVKLERGQRVGRDHVDALFNRQTGRIRIDNESRDAACAGRFARAGEHHIKVGDAAVADPGLAAVQHIAVGRGGGAALHGGHVGARIGLTQGKGAQGLARRHTRQVALLLIGCAHEADGACAQALHGKREVRQAVVKSQRLAQQAELTGVDHVRRCAIGRTGYCMLEPTAAAQQTHQADAFGVHRVAAFVVVRVGQVLLAPSVQAHFEVAVAVVKERPVEFWRVSGWVV